eukprot:snap_masked-scaffold_58-processed-gene-0.50-mRNA-1 protein AED:1.00 eAED:1.00 QI:0/-1/0/0/-1/1/1/0/158
MGKKPQKKDEINIVKDEVFNPLLRQYGWNKKKTTMSNYKKMGLQFNVNDRSILKQKKKPVNEQKKVTLGDVMQQNVNTEKNLSRKNVTKLSRPDFYLTEDEERYLRPLVKRYGLDRSATKKMFMDIKLNRMQRTMGWLKNKISIYKRGVDAGKLASPL